MRDTASARRAIKGLPSAPTSSRSISRRPGVRSADDHARFTAVPWSYHAQPCDRSCMPRALFILPVLAVIPLILFVPAQLAVAAVALSVGAFLLAIGLAVMSRPVRPVLESQVLPIGELRIVLRDRE